MRTTDLNSLAFVTIFNNLLSQAGKLNEPHREKTGFLPMRKQRRRSASQ